MSVVSGIVYAVFENVRAKRRLEYISNVGDLPEIADSALRLIQEFRKAYVTHQNTYFKLREHESKRFLVGSFDYSYHKKLPRRTLTFAIRRFRGDSENSMNPAFPEHEAAASQYELWHTYDETTFDSTATEIDYIYQVTDLRINGQAIELKNCGSNGGQAIIYRATVPTEISIDSPITISYRVEAPFEWDSFAHVDVDLPTRTTKCYFDLSLLDDELDMSHFGSACSIARVKGETKSSSCVLYEHQEWIFPKSTFFLMWWRKPESKRGGENEHGATSQ